MKKVLVTGASWFIGNHLCKYLIKLNYSVIETVRNLDNNDNDYNRRIYKYINKKLKYINVNLRLIFETISRKKKN
jgi:nucleoside-diphosphate-sugar epimerase